MNLSWIYLDNHNQRNMKNESRKLAGLIVSYMRAKGYHVANNEFEANIVYLEGSDKNGMPITDRMDEWNDRRLVITAHQGQFVLIHNASATCEPGLSATKSKAAEKRGGVFRIMIGQQRGKWIMGYHKRKSHPALVQKPGEQVMGHRDKNLDGFRTNEPLSVGSGINQHSTHRMYKGGRVGNFSEGCLVEENWIGHLMFIQVLESDPRYIADKNYAWDTTVIDTTDFNKWLKTSRNEDLQIAKP
jgi:hypothetical protein